VAIYGLDGAWEVENVGVAPDVEVERLPADCRDGRDPQLERAVALLLERLSQQPPKAPRRPPYPVYRTLPTSAP
jgi:tricorn protease